MKTVHYHPLHRSLICHTFHPVTFGDPDDVNHLVLIEDRGHGDGLLQFLLGPVHLLRDGPTIQLHLHDVGLLRFEGQKANLRGGRSVNKHPNLLLATLVCPLLGILGKCLLLALVPERQLSDFFVESAFAFITEMLSEDGLEGSQAADCFNISHNPHHHHWRCLNDSDCLHRLPAVHLSLAGVIFGPAAGLPPVLFAALVGQEAHVITAA
uniref:Uncharacterized protein n=1 Tax=Esox lucius TaxID=8010 RepID=A0A3P8XQA2_ESOLU